MSDKVSTCPVANGVSRQSQDAKPPDCQQTTSCYKRQNSNETSTVDMKRPLCPIMAKMTESVNENDSHNNVAVNTSTVEACNSCNKTVPTKPVRSTSGYALLQDNNACVTSGNRKTSNISNTSMTSSSTGSDETEEKKLDLRCLIESVGTLLLPVVSNS